MLQARASKPDLVQDYIDFTLEWLQDRGYSLTIDAYMGTWVKATKAAGSTFVNPAFDPEHSRLSPKDSFWLDIRLGSHTIATSAARLFVTDDYLALKRTMKLWYEKPSPDFAELAISQPPDTPVIQGRVGHEGGLWVHPAHRKRGLSVLLPHLNRALCLREWEIDWQTGIAMKGIGECGIAERAYGFPHVVPFYEGHLPVTQRTERLYMTYMDRSELTAGLEIDTVARLLPDGHDKTAHVASRVQKG